MTDVQNIRINQFELKLVDSDDPIASKVSWSPANPSGANFKAQTLSVVGDRVQIAKSTGAKIFASFFVFPGLGAVFLGAPIAFFKGNVALGLFLILWGGLFGGIGSLFFFEKKITFDKRLGVFFRGKQSALNVNRNQQGRLEDIYALQLLSEAISSSSDSGSSNNYLSYELNLVFKDASRLNVMDGGDAQDVERSAKQLAAFLNVPVWKANY